MGHGGSRVENLGQVRHASDVRETTALTQPCSDLDDVGRIEIEARPVDPLVSGREEMLRMKAESPELRYRVGIDHRG